METVVRWTPYSDDASVANMAAEKAHSLWFFEEFSKPDEIGINTCLILQNTLDVPVTALAVQNKREHPNRVKGFVETVIPNYCDPTFAWHFRMKRQTFQAIFVQFKVCYTQVSGPVQTTCSNTLSSICTRHFHTLLCVHNPTKDSVIYACLYAHATTNLLTLFTSQLLECFSFCTCTVFARHLHSLYFFLFMYR